MADDGFSDVADVTDEGYDFAPDPQVLVWTLVTILKHTTLL